MRIAAPPTRRRGRVVAAVPVLLASVLAPACAPAVPEPALLELREFSQAGRSEVALNESLVFHFTRPLDRASVTRESVRIRGPRDEEVEGRFEVRPYQLLFHPRLPLSPELTDGGLRPGVAYAVVLAGFPRPDGLRGRDGAPLAGTLRLGFRTVALGGEGRVFLDLLPGDAAPFLVLQESSIGPLGPLRLTCDQALDPTTLRAEDFELGRFAASVDGAGALETIPLRARLVENRRDRAVLELVPMRLDERGTGALLALDPGQVHLWVAPSRALRTVGGRPVGWRPRRTVPIEVVGPRVGRLVETFETSARRSPEPPPGVDGTAGWGAGGVGVRFPAAPGDPAEPRARRPPEPPPGVDGPAGWGAGGVGVRFPAAAGDGADGEVELRGLEGRADVRATRLVVPAGASCELSASGPVVLRSQGRLEIHGNLVRRVEPTEAGWNRGELHAEWRRRTRSFDDWEVPSMRPGFHDELRRAEERRSTLSEWLEEVLRGGAAWTVLIAGGDLVVHGTVEVDGPLLLAAGGWVRAFGTVGSREAWLLREGGGIFDPEADLAPLVIDEPETNPLRLPLTLAVLSDRIRPPRGVTRWRSASHGVRPGAGRVVVRFLGERDLEPAGTEVFGPVDDLNLLEGCHAVRFLVELSVPAAGAPDEAWDPPRVETVEVSWYEPPRGPPPGTGRSGF